MAKKDKRSSVKKSPKTVNRKTVKKAVRAKKIKKEDIYTVPIKTDDYIELDLGPIVGFLVLLASFVIIGIVIAYTSTHKKEETKASDSHMVQAVIGEDTPVKGSGPVTIIEFSDFECPFCKMYSTSTYKQIITNYVDTGKVQYAFRHFVAVPAHNPASKIEAIAAICADRQGHFWEMHDYLFENTEANGAGIFSLAVAKDDKSDPQKALNNKLIEAAGQMGLDKEQFKQCLADKTAEEKFNSDNDYVNKELAPAITMAGYSGIGTPFFVICKTPKSKTDKCEGTVIIGAQPYNAFESKIEEMMK